MLHFIHKKCLKTKYKMLFGHVNTQMKWFDCYKIAFKRWRIPVYIDISVLVFRRRWFVYFKGWGSMHQTCISNRDHSWIYNHWQWPWGTCMSSYDPLTPVDVSSCLLNPRPDVSSHPIIPEFNLWQKNMFPPQLSQCRWVLCHRAT